MSDYEDVNPNEVKSNYYEMLGVARTATTDEIKRAYRKAALRLHPDHNKHPDATAMFQKLTEAHQVLSDPKKREYYNKYGEVDDEMDGESFDQAYDHWRQVFPKITPEDIENYRKEYVGSSMEEEDIITAYNRCQGDMTLIHQCVPFASSDAIDRLYNTLKDLLTKKKIEKKFSKTLHKTVKGLQAIVKEQEMEEEEEAAEEAKKLGLSSSFGSSTPANGGVPSDLAAVIASRQKKRGESSFLDDLAAKYAQPSKGKGKKAQPTSSKKVKNTAPSDEDFDAFQAKLFAKKK